MARVIRSALILLAPVLFACSALWPSVARGQEPGTVIVSLYRVAPGKHLEFLRWQAARDSAGSEAGLAAAQWYTHMDGDSWDFVSIRPAPTEAQDQAVEGILKRRNLTTGFKAALEFRTLIASHTDTYARGPTTAAALVEAAK